MLGGFWIFACFVAGFAILVFSGDALVRGASTIARRLRVSPLVAGIFIVGVGTSAPEMIVSAQAAAQNHAGLALGNIVGSNIANVWLVLGLPALFAPMACGGFGERRALSAMLGVTAAWIAFLAVRPLSPIVGLVFLTALAGYVTYTFAYAHAAASHGMDVDVEDEATGLSIGAASLLTLGGLVGLPIGAHFIIEGGVGAAEALGVSDEIIGLTIVAIGTSLPEIGATLAAAIRGSTGLVLGNVIGSNLFNVLGAGGIAALFGRAEASSDLLGYGHWVMAGAALTLAAMIYGRLQAGPRAGAAMLAAYGLYVYGLVNDWNISRALGA